MGMFLAGSAILVGMLLQPRRHFIFKLMNAMMLCTLGHFVYEDLFIIFAGTAGRSINALVFYLIITFAIVYCLLMMNRTYPFLKFNKLYLQANLVVLAALFLFLWAFGWFGALQLWYERLGPDPHDFLWALSKAWGFYGWLPLIRRGKG